MQHVLRFTTVLALALAGPLRAEPSDGTAEYKQADTSFYLRNDVLRADPDAVILTPDMVTDIGGSYLVPGHRHPAKVVYLQQTRDWIEPITPPSMPKSLDIPSNVMQVREPQGSVQVALPSAPADFHSVDHDMTLPNGSVLKTGDNGSVAVLFGGVDSVRLAADSQAAVQMTVTSNQRDAEVDIQDGIVFSKVGRRIGEKESYAVRTPFGTATAHGTDFVTVVFGQRVDVWVAEGTVGLESPIGQTATASVEGNGAFKIMRFPTAPDASEALAESAESLTMILNFIPLANQKLEALSDRTRSGAKLTPNERDYVSRIRKIPAMIKLALIEPAGTRPEPIATQTEPTFLAPPQPVSGPMTAITPTPFVTPDKSVLQPLPRHNDVVRTNESTKHHAKQLVTRAAGSSKSKPSVAKAVAYPRAKPVTVADLAPPPAPVVRVTAVKPRVAETSDPNSLGAPLNPYGTPAVPNGAVGTNTPPVPPPNLDNSGATPVPSAATKTHPSADNPNDTTP